MKKHMFAKAAAMLVAALALAGCTSSEDGQASPASSATTSTPAATTATPSAQPSATSASRTPTATRAVPSTTNDHEPCAKVDPAAQKACWYYLNKAVRARVRYFRDGRSLDAMKSRPAVTDLDAWYRIEPGNLGQANADLRQLVAKWDPNIHDNIDVETPRVSVTGGQGAASAGVATLTTVESWNVHTEGTSLVLDNAVSHTVTLLRQPDGSWTVSTITGLIGVG